MGKIYEESYTAEFADYAEHIGVEGMKKGQLQSNMTSIDGLVGLDRPST